jgi:hypothetical protein
MVISAESTGRAAQKLPKLALICFISLLIPAYFNIGTLLMTPSRLLLLFLIPVLLMRLLGGKYGRVTNIDWLILFHMSWFTLSVFVNNPSVAVTYTGVNTVILLGGYLAARTSIRNLDQFIGFIRFFALVVTLALPFALYETLTRELTIPRLIEMIPGLTSNRDVQYPMRMGLDRVQFVFVHPIHYGFFCSLSVGLFFVAMKNMMGNFRLWGQTAILALMTFLSLSSGPFLSMIFQFLLILWAYVMRNLERPWMTLAWLCLGLYVVLEVASNGPALYYIITKLAFNPGTANARRILLEYGIDQVMMTPVFGIFKRPWNLPPWMTGSLDNYWLGLAVSFGFPTFFSQFLAFILAIRAVAMRNFPKGSALDRVRQAWVTSMISATMTLGTVFVWSEIASFMFFFFAAGLWMLDVEVGEAGDAEPPPQKRRGPRFTRFEDGPQPVRSRLDAAPGAERARFGTPSLHER